MNGKVQLLCLGAHAMLPAVAEAAGCSPALLLRMNTEPLLLIGAGPGVLQSCLTVLGQIPTAIFLPSAKLHHIADIQAIIECAAQTDSVARKLFVYGPADVLDYCIDCIDEDIVASVRDTVEFLQVELGAPTAFHQQFYMITQRCETKSPRYNVCILDTYQRPLLCVIDGPLSYLTVFQQAPCAVVRRFEGLDIPQLYDALECPKMFLVGHVAGDRGIDPVGDRPAMGLRMGDKFILPATKGQWTGHELANSGDRRPGPELTDMISSTGRAAAASLVTRTPSPRPGRVQSALSVKPFQGGLLSTAPVATRSDFSVGQPRKLYLFNNEDKDAEPIIVMLTPAMTLATLKSKVAGILGIRPFGHLYSVDHGLIRDTDLLEHCQELVATKHAGAPFDTSRLPRQMSYTRPAARRGDAFPL